MREATQHHMAFRWHTIDLMGAYLSGCRFQNHSIICLLVDTRANRR